MREGQYYEASINCRAALSSPRPMTIILSNRQYQCQCRDHTFRQYGHIDHGGPRLIVKDQFERHQNYCSGLLALEDYCLRTIASGLLPQELLVQELLVQNCCPELLPRTVAQNCCSARRVTQHCCSRVWAQTLFAQYCRLGIVGGSSILLAVCADRMLSPMFCSMVIRCLLCRRTSPASPRKDDVCVEGVEGVL
jgi:hypothetical protein